MSDTPPGLRLENRQAKYAQGASWAADVHGSLRASRRIAWIVAGAAVTVAVLEAIALAFMAPLKTVVPYTILVDRQTGYVETVQALRPGALTQDQAVTQSALVQYVLARETFDATDLSANYNKVMLWSDGPVREAYRRDMARANPSSPLNLYPASTVVATTIKSVSSLSPTSALVRLDTTRRDAGAASGEQRAYTAVIAYRFTGAPLRNGDRFLNPLGFQVTSYRRDSDTASGVSVPIATAPAAILPATTVASPPVIVPPVIVQQQPQPAAVVVTPPAAPAASPTTP